MKIKIAILVLSICTILISCAPAVKAIPTELAVSPTSPGSSTVSPTSTPTNENKILDVALSADGTKLAIYANTGIYLYDTQTRAKTVFKDFTNLNFDRHKGEEQSGAVAFSPDGNTIAIAGQFADEPVDLWDLSTGKYIMSITDIPPAYRVTKIQFGPDGKSLFIRSNYGWTMRCEQADANFALHRLNFSDPPKATKIFNTDICQTIPMGLIRFTDNNELFIFVQLMGPQYQVTAVNILPTATSHETAYDSLDTLYDISPNGKIYAFMSSQAGSRITKLIDAGTSRVLGIIPYRVKLLNDESRFLVRDFLSTEGEWGLWENGRIACSYDGLRDPEFDWQISANGQNFAIISAEDGVVIWNVADCSIKNVIHLGK